MSIDRLTTERENPASADIDAKSSRDILAIINTEDKKVPFAVEKCLDTIASLVDDVVASFKRGGKLVYIGAGTSGRLGVLDASECPPTYGTDPAMVQGLIAGGKEALVRSIEWAEDRTEDGVRDLERILFTGNDVLVGITASGQAPYVLRAMKHAGEIGAVVAALSCNPGSETFKLARHAIFVDVGPEVVAGSTRMKAGTAQKLVLNMITTAAMIRLGKVYKNYMIDLRPVNRKLIERSKNLIMKVSGCDRSRAEAAFEASGGKPKIAILMVILDIGRDEAERIAAEHDGHISLAIEAYRSGKIS
ncbi:MAG: N-acetylmuramic acid 6-phosphate etherase [Rectinemataceae bacterium]